MSAPASSCAWTAVSSPTTSRGDASGGPTSRCATSRSSATSCGVVSITRPSEPARDRHPPSERRGGAAGGGGGAPGGRLATTASRFTGSALRRRKDRGSAAGDGVAWNLVTQIVQHPQAAARRPAAPHGKPRRDAAAEAPRPAGLLLRPALLERVRDRGDPAGALPRRGRAAAPDTPVAAAPSSSCCSSSSCPTGRPATPTRTAAARTRSAGRTSARTRRSSRRRRCSIDYVLTVAVSSRPASPTSSRRFPELAPHAVVLSLALVVAPDAGEPARACKESGTRLRRARRTGSSSRVFTMIGIGLIADRCSGTPPVAESAAT